MQRYRVQGAPQARVEQDVAAFVARTADAMHALGGPTTGEETTFVFVIGANESFHDATKLLYQTLAPKLPAPVARQQPPQRQRKQA